MRRSTSRHFTTTLAIITCVVFTWPAVTQASTIIYTDRDAFLAVAGATTLTTFDEPVICQATAIPVFCIAQYDDISISYDTFYTVAGATAPHPFIPVSLISISSTFTDPTLMFGVDVCAFEGGPRPETVPIILINSYPIFESGCTFLGFQSTEGTQPFTGLSASAIAGVGNVDNLVVAVPERSSTGLYLTLAALGLILLRRTQLTQRP